MLSIDLERETVGMKEVEYGRVSSKVGKRYLGYVAKYLKKEKGLLNKAVRSKKEENIKKEF